MGPPPPTPPENPEQNHHHHHHRPERPAENRNKGGTKTMRLTEALRYLSRFYAKDRKSVKHKRSRSDVELAREAPTTNDNNGPTSQAAQGDGDNNASTAVVGAVQVQPEQEDMELASCLLAQASTNMDRGSVRRYSDEVLEVAKRSRQVGEEIGVHAGDENYDRLQLDGGSERDRGGKDIPGGFVYVGEGQKRGKEGAVASCTQHNGSAQAAGVAPGNLVERQFSNTTLLSEKSSVTVNHDPSKHSASPITVIPSPSIVSSNPFSDRHGFLQSSEDLGSLSVPKTNLRNRSRGDLLSAEDALGNASEAASSTRVSSGVSSAQGSSRKTSRSSDNLSRLILETPATARRELIRSQAFERFKASAAALGLEVLEPSRGNFPNSEVPTFLSKDKQEKGDQSSRLLGRIRSAKSSFSMRHKSSVRRTVRRIKSMANLSVQYSVGSLKDKTLEDLARLGGHSYLKLPYDYAPTRLKLPTCIASTSLYLMRFGPAVPDLYSVMGNEAAVAELYSHYAGQVLTAESTKGSIDSTTRGTELPDGKLRPSTASMNRTEFTHVVSTVFRHFLHGLPGGILGSKYLYRVLKDIYGHKFSRSGVARDPGRDEYLPDTPPSTAAKIRLTALAIIAMSSEMQLELICVVFGLLSLTADEWTRLTRSHSGSASNSSNEGYRRRIFVTDAEFLGDVFGGLLTDPKSFGQTFITGHTLLDGEVSTTDVATMLVELWKEVCQHLRAWEVFGVLRK
ncbi:hypothetical protein AJ80_00707 [Polytolypa hystricis UAMH7299]|uniref:Rho-GAP domain-containing protein n=1 Tax=Polytolypa hystricis (strain UAMH7299) TaxID=1447883 RepID=A0A2B7Z3Q5_POLH7|nr:hypothetical protein AJ80_00707 [Polytolypa hystricis UAMH7299]